MSYFPKQYYGTAVQPPTVVETQQYDIYFRSEERDVALIRVDIDKTTQHPHAVAILAVIDSLQKAKEPFKMPALCLIQGGEATPVNNKAYL